MSLSDKNERQLRADSDYKDQFGDKSRAVQLAILAELKEINKALAGPSERRSIWHKLSDACHNLLAASPHNNTRSK